MLSQLTLGKGSAWDAQLSHRARDNRDFDNRIKLIIFISVIRAVTLNTLPFHDDVIAMH